MLLIYLTTITLTGIIIRIMSTTIAFHVTTISIFLSIKFYYYHFHDYYYRYCPVVS